MTRATHTPGPWHIGDKFTGRFVYNADGWAVADCRGEPTSRMPFDQKEANARLIAAAPALLEALEAIEGDVWSNTAEMRKLARAAIAKAKGE